MANIKDDFFASDYSNEFENNSNEFPNDDFINELEEALNEIEDSMPEHQNCPCHNVPIFSENHLSKNDEWNLTLSEIDKEEHCFFIHTMDPLVKKLLLTEEYYQEMFNRFVKTFEVNANVLPGHRNS